MSSLSIPSLKLFPLYTGGPILDGKNGLNQNSSFVIPATRYSQSYAVNMTPTTNSYDPNSYVSFYSGNPRLLVGKPISDATNYTTMLGMDNSVPGHLAQVSAPATAPNIPMVFQDRVDNYTITDANYAALMAQPSFEIPGIGMGLLVTTDGNGNVQSESLNPSSWATMFRTNAVGHDLGVLNRAEITLGATYKVDDPGFSFSNINHKNTAAANQKAPQAPSAVGAMGSPNLIQHGGIFNTQPLNSAATTGLDDLTGVNAANPVLAKLNQLQPRDMGLSLSGQEAGIDVTQAQQVAVNQADYGVNLGSDFYQNMASVVNTANNQQQTSYAATYATPMDQLMNGRIYVPHGGGHGRMQASVNSGETPLVNNQVTFNVGAAVSDATSGNSRNGYIPFNMQNGGATAGVGGGFSDPNPFAGNPGSQGGNAQGGFQGGAYSGNGRQSGQQTPYYRKPLAYTA